MEKRLKQTPSLDYQYYYPVWRVLSELYLDNELSDDGVQYLAQRLKSTDLSLVQLEQILFMQVHPVLH